MLKRPSAHYFIHRKGAEAAEKIFYFFNRKGAKVAEISSIILIA